MPLTQAGQQRSGHLGLSKDYINLKFSISIIITINVRILFHLSQKTDFCCRVKVVVFIPFKWQKLDKQQNIQQIWSRLVKCYTTCTINKQDIYIYIYWTYIAIDEHCIVIIILLASPTVTFSLSWDWPLRQKGSSILLHIHSPLILCTKGHLG